MKGIKAGIKVKVVTDNGGVIVGTLASDWTPSYDVDLGASSYRTIAGYRVISVVPVPVKVDAAIGHGPGCFGECDGLYDCFAVS